MTKNNGVQLFLKRLLDIIIAVVALIIASPVIVIISVVIRFKLGSPVFFRQERPGHREKLIKVIKFRTMSDACDESGKLLPDDLRLTGLGRFLRSLSFDELPQLWSVLNGDISLVGPRPLLIAYLDRYTPDQRRRHEVKPGVTGWAQINGRNTLTWEEKFELDVWYVDNWSLWLDIKILLLTGYKVLKREGVTQEGEATIKEFMGTKDTGERGNA